MIASPSSPVPIYMVDSARAGSPEEQRIIANGPSIVRTLLGDNDQQARILGSHIHWDRAIFADGGTGIAGYILFFMRGYGPHEPNWASARNEFGSIPGTARYALCSALFHRFRRTPAYAYKTAVRPAFRHQGVGTAMVEYWIDVLRSNDVEEADLEVWADNDRAITFYRHMGFTVWRTTTLPLPGSPRRKNQLLWMKRQLRGNNAQP